MEQQKDIRRQPFFWDYHDVFDVELSKHALLVRLYLAKCASGDDRKSFPSLGTIAAKCKLSKSSVQRGLKELEEGGWVQIIQRKDEAQKNFSNLYLLRHPSDDMVTETIPYGQGDYTLWSDRLPPIVPVTTKQELSNKNKDTNICGDGEKIPFAEIISYLNEKTGRKFQNVPANKKLIQARWNEGYRLDDFKLVIDKKVGHWKDNEEMKHHLQPITLFSNKFDKYMNEPIEDPFKKRNPQPAQSAPTANAADETRAFINSLRGEQDAPKRDGGEGDNWLDLEGLLSDQGN